MNTTPILQLITLGRAEIYLDGQLLAELKPSKARGLLFYMAVTGQAASRNLLVSLFWSDMPDAKAKGNLRQALRWLRRLLPHHVEITREWVRLRPEAAVELDSALFEADVTAGFAGDVKRLETAVSRYEGDFLAGFHLAGADGFDEWALGVSERLRSDMLQALYMLSEHYAAQHATAAGLHYTRRLLEMEPWREESHRQMMRLLAWDGQISAALAQYKQCRDILAAELGVAPATATITLFERIRQLRDGGRSNLPVEQTVFVGRETELAAFTTLLARPEIRLICVTGVGGVGKSRFARQAVQSQRLRYLDGVYLVSLDGVTRVEHVPAVIAEAAGLTLNGHRSPQEELLRALRGKEILLLLDNFEHLLPAAPLLAEIAATAPGVKLVVTSRERLNLRGEQVFPLEGLPAPAEPDHPDFAASAAARLFTQAARRVRPDFSFTAERAGVAAICAQVQGLPLALELAASWVAVYDCATIAARIAADMDFLQADWQDAPERHTSLQATLAGSWQLLSPREQKWLSRLGVFYGRFSPAAATAITAANDRELATLVDKSLLIRAGDYFTLHPLVRQFCLARLAEAGEIDVVRAAHQKYYFRFLREETARARGEMFFAVVQQLRQARENFLAAWEYATERGDVAALEAACRPLARFCLLTNLFVEGEALFRKTAGQLPADTPRSAQLQAALWAQAAALAVRQDRYAAGEETARRVLAMPPAVAGDEARAYALTAWGEALWRQYQYAKAQPVLEEAITLFEKLGYTGGLADAQRHLGVVYYRQGKLEEGLQHLETALHQYRADGNLLLENAVLNNLFLFRYCAYRLNESDLVRLEEVVRLNDQMGNRWGKSFALSNLGYSYIHLGQYEKAIFYHQQALHIRRVLGNPGRMAISSRGLGMAAAQQGNVEKALTFLQQALRWARQGDSYSDVAAVQLELGKVLAEAGRLAEARDVYDQARLVLKNDTSFVSLKLEAGLIHLALLEEQRERAAERAAAVCKHLDDPVFLMTAASAWMLWICYQALADYEPALADRALAKAFALVQTQLDNLRTETLRCSFVENVPHHRAILAAGRLDGNAFE